MRGPDRSGPLRLIQERRAEPLLPSPELPGLAVIAAYIAKRPPWAANDPFPVPLDIYEASETEMRMRMKQRGFALPTSGDLTRDSVRNFLLNGVPIVIQAPTHG